MFFRPHSTRLFPRSEGADAYVLSGIAQRCDWVVLSDRKAPEVKLIRSVPGNAPRHVFLSLRSPFAALAYFVQEVLPQIDAPFVLVSGSEDVSIPKQTDARWRQFNDREKQYLHDILQHPYLLRWFAENLDDDIDPRFEAFPLGLVFKNGAPEEIPVPDVPPLATRRMKVLCAHRVREGEQWEPRKRVTAMAKAHWQDWCTVLEEEISESDYVEQIEAHAFVLCVQGGGLDPSPKAWQCLLHGAIPIIADSPLRGAYNELPVAVVPEWTPQSLSPEVLSHWRNVLEPHFDAHGARKSLVEKLGLDYWWDRIEKVSR